MAVLLIFHAVGFWGLLFSQNPETFQNLTPLNLLLTAALLFLNHPFPDRKFALFAGFTFAAGFLSEVLGVHTGWPFGNYAYGEALGFKLWNVPFLIGLNWLVLVYCCGCLLAQTKTNPVLRAVLAALLMTGLDILIEPVAMRFDFWHWQNQAVPLQNYAAWFGLAFLLQLFLRYSGVNRQNPLAAWVLGTQGAFFLLLNYFI